MTTKVIKPAPHRCDLPHLSVTAFGEIRRCKECGIVWQADKTFWFKLGRFAQWKRGIRKEAY